MFRQAPAISAATAAAGSAPASGRADAPSSATWNSLWVSALRDHRTVTELDGYGRWVVVAGGSEGVGAEFALLLAEAGLNLMLLARKPGPLAETAARCRALALEVRTLAIDLVAPGSVAAIADATAHQNLISRCCCHFLGPVVATVDGDTAVAVCEFALSIKGAKGFHVYRAGANHFRLDRRGGRWQIVHPTTRALDGGTEARELLAAGVAGVIR
jgi:hypothetical protein